jgi:hypothetical protein
VPAAADTSEKIFRASPTGGPKTGPLFIAAGDCSTYISDEGHRPSNPMKKHDPKTYDGCRRPDETPRSFRPEDWVEAIANGGYWCALGDGWWVPVRDTDAREALIERTMEQHGLSRREAVEMLDAAGM